MVPVTVDGEQVKLAVITYKPAGDGPFPALVFHHGSTGHGDNPSYFAHPYDPKVLADWFTARGWAVLLPSRRGRGGSEGRYSRSNFAAFEAAGGKGTFHEYGVSAVVNGHGISTVPSLWSSTLQAYLEERGLPAKAK